MGYVVNTRFIDLLFYSDLTQTNEIRLRHDSDICVKKWRVKPLLIGIGEKREQIWCKMCGKREQKAQRARDPEVSEFPLSAHEYFSAVVNSSKKEVQGCVL